MGTGIKRYSEDIVSGHYTSCPILTCTVKEALSICDIKATVTSRIAKMVAIT